jgi:hypothetical protein
MKMNALKPMCITASRSSLGRECPSTWCGLLANGLTPEEIIRDYYDHITKEDILACLRYAQALVEEEEVHAV